MLFIITSEKLNYRHRARHFKNSLNKDIGFFPCILIVTLSLLKVTTQHNEKHIHFSNLEISRAWSGQAMTNFVARELQNSIVNS